MCLPELAFTRIDPRGLSPCLAQNIVGARHHDFVRVAYIDEAVLGIGFPKAVGTRCGEVFEALTARFQIDGLAGHFFGQLPAAVLQCRHGSGQYSVDADDCGNRSPPRSVKPDTDAIQERPSML